MRNQFLENEEAPKFLTQRAFTTFTESSLSCLVLTNGTCRGRRGFTSWTAKSIFSNYTLRRFIHKASKDMHTHQKHDKKKLSLYWHQWNLSLENTLIVTHSHIFSAVHAGSIHLNESSPEPGVVYSSRTLLFFVFFFLASIASISSFLFLSFFEVLFEFLFLFFLFLFWVTSFHPCFSFLRFDPRRQLATQLGDPLARFTALWLLRNTDVRRLQKTHVTYVAF